MKTNRPGPVVIANLLVEAAREGRQAHQSKFDISVWYIPHPANRASSSRRHKLLIHKVFMAKRTNSAACYRSTLKSWFVVDLDPEIAESAARLRAALKLKLADALQAASALAIGADALVTHDRDFSALRDLCVLGVKKQLDRAEQP